MRKGDVLCIVDSHEDVLKFMGRFMQYYRENAKYLERTYGFVERVGIEHIKKRASRRQRGNLRAAGRLTYRRPSMRTRIHG